MSAINRPAAGLACQATYTLFLPDGTPCAHGHASRFMDYIDDACLDLVARQPHSASATDGTSNTVLFGE